MSRGLALERAVLRRGAGVIDASRRWRLRAPRDGPSSFRFIAIG